MDRNSVIGLILIAGILVIFSIFNSPSEEEQRLIAQQRDSIARAEEAAQKTKLQVEKDSSKTAVLNNAGNEVVVPATDSSLIGLNADSLSAVRDSIQMAQESSKLNERFGIFSASAKGEKKYAVIENDKIRVTTTNQGARIVSAEVKNYRTYSDFVANSDQPLRLFDEDSTSIGLRFNMGNLQLNTLDLFAQTTSGPLLKVSGENNKITYRFATENAGKYLEVVYTLPEDGYAIKMDINVVGLESEGVASSLEMNWNSKLLSTERLVDNEKITSSVFFKYTESGRSYLSESSSDQLTLEANASWIAFKQSYFSAVVMSEKGINYDGSQISINMINSKKYIKEYNADLNISTADAAKSNVALQFYFGPNDRDELAKFNNGMEDIVNIGWGIFGWVNKWLVIPVFNLLDSLGINYGLIIILLTLIVKIIIMPLTYKNYKSSAKMRVLKPEVDEIGKRIGTDDPLKKQQEVMALYRKSGVNPMAGCIPMLIQMPVLIAVFRFFPSAIQLRQQGFLWAEDLSSYDSVLNFGFSIPLYGDHISLFALLMAVSTILITRMNSGQMDTSMPGMKFMMYFFPVMMIFFFNSMASGLSFYYFISNIMSLVIMWGIKKWFIDEQKILAQIHENRKNPKTQKKSAFMQRLEEAQRMQQQKKNGGKK
ncbi:MAG: membrane protein insertase YidC [Flavobacteriales bacterium]|nr:membrane protein insertase YidC [Flavobacteriales bacterium]